MNKEIALSSVLRSNGQPNANTRVMLERGPISAFSRKALLRHGKPGQGIRAKTPSQRPAEAFNRA
jgi:hypothetical protein